VHVDPDVPLLPDDGLPGMEAHADAQLGTGRPLVRRERALSGNRRGDRVPAALEAVEERVALGVDLLSAPGGERVADQAAMLRERVGVAFAEPLEKLRRPLDVREDERDGAAVERRHALSLSPSSSCDRRRRTRGFASLTISSRYTT
jgi:hypothetical protein